MGLSGRCLAATPAGSPGPRSWRPGASPWPSSSCSAGGLPGPLSDIRSLRRWRSRLRRRLTVWLSVAPGEPGGGAQLAVPLALADATPAEGQADGPGFPGSSSSRRSGTELAVPEADRGPEHFIYLARKRRVHKPDPDEANAERAAWRAVGCGWPYGGRQSSSGCLLRRGVLPSLLPGGAGGLQRGRGEFVGFVLQRFRGPPPRLTEHRSSTESGGSTSDVVTRSFDMCTDLGLSISAPARNAWTAASAMARPIAVGYMTVPWAPGGDPGWDLAANLSTLAFPDSRTVWDEFSARHGLSENAARMLRLVGRDTLVEFAAWASTEQEFFTRCTRPWLNGFLSRVSRGWDVSPRCKRPPSAAGDVAPGSTYSSRLVGRGHAPYGHDPLWKLASLPARWARQWAVHTHLTDSDDHPMFGCILAQEIRGVGAAFPGSRVAGRLCARDLQPPGLLSDSSGAVGAGRCTALAAKARRTRSPSAGGA